MRRIHKRSEPRSLADHRRDGGTYETYAKRDDVRATLLKEQGGICCYCMQRISLRNMRVEHWESQSDQPTRTLDYDNLLGACTGGENTLLPDQRHCDVHRKDEKLHVHPAKSPPSCEQVIQYLADGTVTSDDKTIKKDLQETLNLNTKPIKDGRKGALDRLLSALRREQKDGHWPPALLEQHAALWRSLDQQGEHREFCQVVIYYLEKKLKKKA